MTSLFTYQESPRIEIYMNDGLRSHRTYTTALFQLANASMLSGIVEPLIGMPDLCSSYGLPVGGIAVTDVRTGEISLNAIGGDINCGYSFSQTNIPRESLASTNRLFTHNGNQLTRFIKEEERKSKSGLSSEIINQSFVKGVISISNNDHERIENGGTLQVINSNIINSEMIRIGLNHLGSLGTGNHFIDVLECKEIYDSNLCSLWGINSDFLTTLIHSGSRGIGAYIKNFFSKPDFFSSRIQKIFQPRKFDSVEGREILDAFSIGANFAYANRTVLRDNLRNALCRTFSTNVESDLIYDSGHNSISIEKHFGKEVVVHRKGASKALAENKNPEDYYSSTGTPIIIPGSFGTDTYLLVANKNISQTFNSIAHGAGRRYSRGYVLSKKDHPRFKHNLSDVYLNLNPSSFVDESPNAYKDINQVVGTLEEAGLVRKVAKFKPVYVYMEKER